MTGVELLVILQKLERLNEKVNEILLNGAELLQTLHIVRDEIKELPTDPMSE